MSKLFKKLNYHLLMEDELKECANYYNENEIVKYMKKLDGNEGESYPCPLVDLYISTHLYSIGIKAILPTLIKNALIGKKTQQEIRGAVYELYSKVYKYFPREVTDENVSRVKRVHRILIEIAKSKTINVSPRLSPSKITTKKISPKKK